MRDEAEIRELLSAYPQDCQAAGIEPLGTAGGFSGARFWRLKAARGTLCLRCWPREHPSSEGLEFIHAVLKHVERQGFRLAAVPVDTLDETSYVSRRGRLWELAPWIAGRPETSAAGGSPRLRAAMTALAEMHQAAASFPAASSLPAVSPGIVERKRHLEGLLAGGIGRLEAAIRADLWPQGARPAQRLVELFHRAAPQVAVRLRAAKKWVVPLQPCLRDIWSDHVLFVGDEVSGLIDFGAMRMENVAADVARLLGSLAADERSGWEDGLAAYEAVRRLSGAERELVTAFDQSTVLMAGLNWIDWIYCQGRQFEGLDVIAGRLEGFLGRLQSLE